MGGSCVHSGKLNLTFGQVHLVALSTVEPEEKAGRIAGAGCPLMPQYQCLCRRFTVANRQHVNSSM